MAIYKFRVTFENFEDVYRDIEIQSEMTLSDLHYAILSSISFDSIHKGVFFESDHSWRKGDELLQVSPEGAKGAAQKDLLSDIIYDPRQRFLYTYDEAEKWGFTIELIKILPDDSSLTTSRCVHKAGTAPKQYKEAPLKFKSTDEPDGRKNRKKKEAPKEIILDDEDEDDEEDAPKVAGGRGKVAAAVIADDEEEEEDDSDAYETEEEEFDVDDDEKGKFTADDDDDDDDDGFGADDDDDDFGAADEEFKDDDF
ncbi:MAG: plasmid pRiA4b ORF-3 family protein [Sphingobacteriales bacterium JAD_PAG50586_3]|nr:MAG: plasmid pRiA4b ORF-3 family protein [Sphingobacteriales bacterium JAD_PAG50586_3]